MIKKIKITSTIKDRYVAEGRDFLNVKFNLLDEDDSVLESLSLEFGMDQTTEEIEAELKKYLDVRMSDEQRSIENADFEETQKNADKVISDLKDSIII